MFPRISSDSLAYLIYRKVDSDQCFGEPVVYHCEVNFDVILTIFLRIIGRSMIMSTIASKSDKASENLVNEKTIINLITF